MDVCLWTISLQNLIFAKMSHKRSGKEIQKINIKSNIPVFTNALTDAVKPKAKCQCYVGYRTKV
jgi:hypothetical protein